MRSAPDRRLDLAARAGGGLVAGLLVAGSLPPFGFWPLGIAGCALLAATCSGATPRRRLLAGLLAGVGQFGPGLAFAARFSLPGAVVLVGFEAALFGAACTLVPRGAGAVPAFAGWCTLAEAVRDRWPFGGLPLGGVALGQAGGPLLAAARVGGPLLVAGAAYLAGAGIAALARRDRRRSGLAALAAAGGLVLGGALAPDGGPARATVPVELVQGGGPRGLDALQVPAGLVYASALAPTERLHPGRAGLVVWPEDVVRLPTRRAARPAERALGDIARHLRATLVAGVTIPVGRTRFDNQLVVWGPSGRVVARFEKVHPVPFGEYVPLRSIVRHVANLSDIPRDAVPGHGTGGVATPAGRLALLVSFEDFFTGRGRSGVRAGGQLLVLATNTASYATSQVPGQELAASRLQAVANGRELVQAATTGYSGAVSPTGAVLARSSLGARDVVHLDARLRTGTTLYVALGGGPTWWAAGALAGFGAALALRRRRRPRTRRPAPEPPAGQAAQPTPAVSSPLPPSPIATGSSPGAGSTGSFANRTRLKRTNLPTHKMP